MKEESPRQQMRRPDSDRASSQRRTPRVGRGAQGIGERYIAGVPARIMRPRLIFLACLFSLVCFGLLMVYSASSVEALHENGSATYFLFRQFMFTVLGVAALEFIVRVAPDSWFGERWLKGALGFMVVLLLAVLFVGSGSRGATRWLNIAGIQFQPSEFLKPFAIAYSAIMLDRVFSPGGDINEFIKNMGVCLVPSLFLIFIQPDFGTVLIILLTLVCMAFFAGLDPKFIVVVILIAVVVGVIAVVAEPYRWVRMQVAWNPWADEYGDGYQATLAIMAFASGGLFGRGIGNSTMKYSYLPEAHNDYILAIIGEEVGFVGTLLFFLVFALLIWSAFRIAEQATDRRGALMASGSAVILAVQFLINALGILNVFPMTGKPLPFISYGGSSMIVSLVLAGLILRVSHESARRDEYDRRRDSFAVMDESTAGVPHTRGERSSRGGFTVLNGFASESDARPRPRSAIQGRPQRPTPRNAGGGYNRIDLNSDPSARLRTDDQGPRVRRDYHDR